MGATTARPEFGGDGAAREVRQAYQILRWGLATIPVITGIDKLGPHALTEWTIYVAPVFVRVSPIAVDALMQLAGLAEIAIGAVVAARPRIGAWVLAAWLAAIVLDLLLTGMFFDVALRDVGLGLGAIALARLAARFEDHAPGGARR